LTRQQAGLAKKSKQLLRCEKTKRATSADCEAWTGPLNNYIAGTLSGSDGTDSLSGDFVNLLLRSGRIGVVFDGISEIQRSNSVDDILTAIRNKEDQERNCYVTCKLSRSGAF
jgi:hypothetical protein